VGLQKKIGLLKKDTSSGPFIDEWNKSFAEISKDLEEVDIAPAISAAALSVKDGEDLVYQNRWPQFFFLTVLIMDSALCETPPKLV
jgi:nucleosome binding factor SPN SPT16 subunit